MIGFVVSLVTSLAALLMNIIITMHVTVETEVIIYSVIILAALIVGLVLSIKEFRNADKGTAERKYARIGIVLSILFMVVTVIFLWYDIVELNTTHFGPVHG